VALTFDDGYEDNLAAAQMLSRRGISATFYITAGCTAEGAPFWPAEVRALIRAVPGPLLALSTLGTTVEIPLRDESDRRLAIRTVNTLLKAHPIPVRERFRDELRAAAGGLRIASPMLRWDQIGEMARLGMTIGAHTLTHPNLPNAGLADAAAEISGSKHRLEDALNAPVTMFSYPNGGAERHYTPELQRLVRSAGYEAATTSRNGFARPESDPYALERVQVHERLEDFVFALEVERFAFAAEA
jgi:peptidoglycan/xylan/chitin deacetylase (PgdA/CDA1 family)